MPENLLSIHGLSLSYGSVERSIDVLHDVSFDMAAGRTLGIVGESGSGKSTVGLSILGLLPASARVTSGAILFDNTELLTLDTASKRALRGARISMVFQDPFTSLNPALSIGTQVAETLKFHRGLDAASARTHACDLLSKVRIPDAEVIMRAYPHQLSGGMKQRVMIASALACSPQLLILDEPTTALDVTTEAAILDLLRSLRAEYDLSMIFISHNLSVVSRFCDDVCVLYAGTIVESGSTTDVFANPAHPYTKGLVAAVPKLQASQERLPVIPGRLPTQDTREKGCVFKPRCAFAEPACSQAQPLEMNASGRAIRCWKAAPLQTQKWPVTPAADANERLIQSDAATILSVHGLQKTFELGRSFLFDRVPRPLQRLLARPTRQVFALRNVSINIKRGEILGVLGESGSGKSTLARCVVALTNPSEGEIKITSPQTGHGAPKSRHRTIQMVFQNPSSSLNPRRKIRDILERPLILTRYGDRRRRHERISELLELVQLPGSFRDRYPRQLSGGERQRVGIARALAMNPDLIICDEALSALDVSVQASVINLLLDLRSKLGVSYLFISHDISVVAHIADRIAVMFAGTVVEEGVTRDVLSGPAHPYTAELIEAAAFHRVSNPSAGESRSNTGCVFHSRCPSSIPGVCDVQAPHLRDITSNVRIACHLSDDALPSVHRAKIHKTAIPA